METDLHRVIYSKQQLSDEHAQYFIYQILRGLKYLHSANVIHRDLKPSNILVNKNCDLKICDFGLARGIHDEPSAAGGSNLTDYVVTRWYRAPEVVLLASEYTKAIDIWSVGCILCELIGRKALFAGKDHLDQIKKIIEILGTPSSTDLAWLPSEGPARRFLNKCPLSPRRPLSDLYPKANPAALEAAARMLTFNPNERPSVEETLSHGYFTGLHSPVDEPVAENIVDWKFDNFKPTKKLLQNLVYGECSKFHPEILKRDQSVLQWSGIDKILQTMN
jgi:mitogen-activated protein kinase 1/3